MSENEISLRLQFPCTISICGPTFSGKSFLVARLIKERDNVFDKKINTVVYVYKEDQPLFKELAEYDKNIKFTKSITEAEDLAQKNTLLILDDVLLEASGEFNRLVSELFIIGAHHRQITPVILLQNPFQKNLRLLAINCLYLALMKSPRDISCISHIGRQFCPGKSKYLMDAYKKATEKPNSYLFFNFTQQFPDKFRVRNSIFVDESLEIYVQSDGEPHSKRSKTLPACPSDKAQSQDTN